MTHWRHKMNEKKPKLTEDGVIQVILLACFILLLILFLATGAIEAQEGEPVAPTPTATPFTGDPPLLIQRMWLPVIGVDATWVVEVTECRVDYDEWGGYIEYCTTCRDDYCIGCTSIYDSYGDLVYYECNGIELHPDSEPEGEHDE
jgi:hypothetical protein